MLSLLRCAVLTLAPLVLITGCASLGSGSECRCLTGAKAESSREKALDLGKQRLMLSEGYSLLYQDAAKFELSELILYVKAESQAIDEIMQVIGAFGGELKTDLERIARDYPGVRIDLDPLPELEQRKRMAIAKDRALYFAPVVGRGGREYERTVLIALSNAFNHESHLCQVMAEEEPDAGLKKFLLATEQGYAGLYDRSLALLNREYFRDPTGKSKD